MKTINYYLTATAITLIAMLTSCDNESYIDLSTTTKFESPTVVINLNTLNGHEFVDLGLSVKWATCNVDAVNAEEFGEYYAWGDDKPYSHVAHILDSIGLRKEDVVPYNSDSFMERLKVDALGRGLIRKGVDIASYKWGEGWRLPSKEEFDELYDNCIWQEVIVDDAVCYKVTSKIPGYTDRHIILPNAGFHYIDNETEFLDEMVYWTGTIHHYDMVNLFVYNMKERYNCFSGAAVGYPVRPVCK